jgi:hypothetical protein
VVEAENKKAKKNSKTAKKYLEGKKKGYTFAAAFGGMKKDER